MFDLLVSPFFDSQGGQIKVRFGGTLRVRPTSEREGKPLFLVCLSTTNHPPYKTPTGYQVKPLSYEALPVWKTRDSKIARSIMETYQYASDSLGHFILDIPKETRGQTIIVATGDHNTRTIFEYPASSLLNHQFGVPLFFSVPKAWRPTNPDTRKWVGHFDVFPTLRELVLKEPARAFEGRNVYGTEEGFSLSFSYAVGGTESRLTKQGPLQTWRILSTLSATEHTDDSCPQKSPRKGF